MISEKSLPRQSQKYFVSETFYTIQGEGPSLGEPAFFIRLQGCDVGCEVCDTKYTWPYNIGPTTSVEELVDLTVRAGSHNLVVITGGEPTDQPLHPLCDALINSGFKVEIETSGKNPPSSCPPGTRINLSPKLKCMNAKLDTHKYLTQFAYETTATFKFVVAHDEDIMEVVDLCRKHNIPYDRVMLMPEGLTPAKVQERHQWLAEAVKELANGMRMTTRFHILTWGPKRGV
jgi:7-carboxy-7-deazaguanine synthase